MRSPSPLDYAYAVGRIRALERGLMSSSDLREAAEEKNFSHAVKVIFDAGAFDQDWTDIKEISQLDEILEYEEIKMAKTVEELLLDKEFSLILDRIHILDEALVQAERSGVGFMKDYIKHAIDLANLKVFLRFKHLGFPVESLGERIISGGFVEEKLFEKNYDLSFSDFGEKLHFSPYRDIWERAADALVEKESFIMMDKVFEDFLMGFLRRARHIVFGPEPVFAYAFAKKRELQLIRHVAVGKLNQIPPDLIKQRISETYV